MKKALIGLKVSFPSHTGKGVMESDLLYEVDPTFSIQDVHDTLHEAPL